MGICVWSPRLDKIGNSCKGVEFCRRLVQKYPDFHLFNNLSNNLQANYDILDHYSLLTMFITAAAEGNLEKLQEMKEFVDANDGDYDNRTALHLSCANGHLETVRFLLSCGADPKKKDRWGNTALHEVKINRSKDVEKYTAIETLLQIKD